jgi:hypothetical protein
MGASYYLSAPSVQTNAYLFSGSATVAAIETQGLPGTLRYTLDGSIPTRNSTAYTDPITVTRVSKIELAYVTNSGNVGEATAVTCLPAKQFDVLNPVAGWQASYYEGVWSNVPDFSKLQAVKSGLLAHISTEGRPRDENFGMEFTGYFKADEDGVYKFTLGSDDGSTLSIDGATVIDNDGAHPMVEKVGRVWMPRGWHKIDVSYFQGGGAFGLSLSVQAPGSTDGPIDPHVFQKGT